MHHLDKITATIILLVCAIICKSQTIQTKYYNNEWLEKEVNIEKAKFSKTISENPDGTVTTEVFKLKNNEKLRSETFKGEEPFGVWFYSANYLPAKLDYNFPLIYENDSCIKSLPKIKDYFEDDATINYKAPGFSKNQNFYQYLGESIRYPNGAKDNGIQGTVYLIFNITKGGNVENVRVKKGINILLDKEAIRVIREMKFSKSATLNGETIDYCMIIPIKFVLR